MPYRVEYRPARGKPPWAKVRLYRSGRRRIVSRHKTRAAAEASIRAYYATREDLAAAPGETGVAPRRAPSIGAGCLRGPFYVVNRVAPARLDPTRTSAIRRQFIRETRRRFRELYAGLRELIVELDAFGLEPLEPGITGLQGGIAPRAYAFRTSAEKLKLFRDWLSERLKQGLVRVSGEGEAARPWTFPYIESTVKQARLDAWIKVRKLRGRMSEEREAFIRKAFLQPESASKVRLLALRTFEQMRGVSADVAARMNRAFADALTEGLNPRETARRLVEVTALPRARAETIARTEIIHAHAETTLDSYAELGVRGVSIQAEWTTAGDDRVCPDCAAREGTVYELEEARGLIPLHPNCRCAWLPLDEK